MFGIPGPKGVWFVRREPKPPSAKPLNRWPQWQEYVSPSKCGHWARWSSEFQFHYFHFFPDPSLFDNVNPGSINPGWFDHTLLQNDSTSQLSRSTVGNLSKKVNPGTGTPTSQHPPHPPQHQLRKWQHCGWRWSLSHRRLKGSQWNPGMIPASFVTMELRELRQKLISLAQKMTVWCVFSVSK